MQKVEALIVGQGLAGSLLAFEFLQKNIDFRIVNTRHFQAASSVAAGIYNPLVFKRITKTWLADSLQPEMFYTYRNLEKMLESPFIHEKQILKLISDEEYDWWMKRSNETGASDFIQDVIEYPVISGVKDFRAGAKISSSGFVDLKSLLHKHRLFLENKSLCHQEVFVHDDLQLKTNYGIWKDITFKKIIFCEGSYAVNNPFFPFIEYYLTKGEILKLKSSKICTDYILNKDAFLLPLEQDLFVAGSTYDWNYTNSEISSQAKEIILEKLSKFLSLGPDVIEQYAGIRPTIKDRRPVLGVHPEINYMYYLNGLGTKGVMLAPYMVKVLSNFIQDNKKRIPLEISVERFLSKKKC